MSSKTIGPATRLATAMMVGVISAYAPSSQAFFDSMNPSRWFGGDDYYDRDYYGGPGPYGYGLPGYGPGHYGAPYGLPGLYGAPGYGAAGYYGNPGYYGAPPASAASGATPDTTDQDREIETLKRRIEALEANRPERRMGMDRMGPMPSAPPSPPQPPEDYPSTWPPTPSFRPLDDY
ncbi:hypothetical protein Thimo_2566 [Thioflavicoccus mobilis 8321]|uniref:Uncharacterized protein n=1 Tax=Thioflavicoccus mobilis 8321 TaxID=765912 RepID=L0H0X6_9GAMM|nr:hypothetical protein [Thioflavicoccus mobilis]AGA91290.1 hypothetical protein Thimo_2566 [Thioflavicoccus mobilis 8321]